MKKKLIFIVFSIVVSLALLAGGAADASTTIEDYKASVVRVYSEDNRGTGGIGSGFVINDGWHVVTNWHVIYFGLQEGMAVVFDYDKLVEVEIIWWTEANDLAVLQMPYQLNRPSVTFVTSDQVQVGDDVLALGFPGAADYGSQYTLGDKPLSMEITVTKGIISAKKIHGQTNVYQTDASINQGNSGGPMMLRTGQVIGVNTWSGDPHMRESGQSEGIAYAVMIEHLLGTLDELGIPYRITDRPAELDQIQEDQTLLYFGLFLSVGLSGTAVFLATTKRGRVIVKEAVSRSRMAISRRQDGREYRYTETKPVLYGQGGYFAGQRFELEGGELIIGRDSKQCNLVFPPDALEISRKHAVLRYLKTANCFSLEDYSSTGTFLSHGERLVRGAQKQLRPGEQFYLSKREHAFKVGVE